MSADFCLYNPYGVFQGFHFLLITALQDSLQKHPTESVYYAINGLMYPDRNDSD